MSKYQELCSEYHEALDRFNQYTECCYMFADEFFNALKNYFKYPADSVKFYAPQEELDLANGCSLRDAMLHNPDGFFTVYFSLTLKDAAAEDVVFAAARIKKLVTGFRVKIGMSRQEFEITKSEDMIPAFDYIYDGIKNYYQKDEFIKKSNSNPIGFAV